jgi:hypothetical protein
MRCSPRIIGAVAASLTVPALGVTALAGPAGAATSAASEYNASLRSATSEGVHYVSKASEQGVSITVIGDTGVTSGQQTLKLQKGSLIENVMVTLIGDTGYVKANAPALVNILGLTATKAGAYADKWLSFPTTNSTLAELVAGLHDKDVATELKMSGPYSLDGTKTVNGQSTEAIKGSVSSSSGKKVPVILYIAASGTPRPVEEITNPGKGGSAIRGEVSFSKWGEKIHPVTPKGAISLLSVMPATSG